MDGWTGQSCRKRNIERQIRILVNWVIAQDGETIIFARNYLTSRTFCLIGGVRNRRI